MTRRQVGFADQVTPSGPHPQVVQITFDETQLIDMAQRLERDRVAWMDPFPQGHARETYKANPDPLRGTGVEIADEVHFPLDRYHTLMMVSRSLPVTVLELEPDNVLFCNALMASWSYRHVFQYPDDSPLGEVMPQDERSLGSMNERELRPVNNRGQG